MLCSECKNRESCERAGIPLNDMISAMVGMCALQDLHALSITHSRELSPKRKGWKVEEVLHHIQQTYNDCPYCQCEAC